VVDASPQAAAQAQTRSGMSESLNSAIALYAAALGAWALLSGLRGTALARGQVGGLILPVVAPGVRAGSRWDAGVIAVVCLALAVVCVRLRATWGPVRG
jgi:hypothetical protein